MCAFETDEALAVNPDSYTPVDGPIEGDPPDPPFIQPDSNVHEDLDLKYCIAQDSCAVSRV